MAFAYRNLIFSHHAQLRLKDRSITAHQIWETLTHPDKKFSKPHGSGLVFERTMGSRRFQLVATKLENQDKWLIVSCWVRGEADRQSLIWRLLTLPFKLGWWLIKFLFEICFPVKSRRYHK